MTRSDTIPPSAPTRGVELPPWAQVTEKRLAHIERVTAMLDDWARAMRLSADEARAWHDAGVLHDALRDAPEALLRELAGPVDYPVHVLHGPASAERLVRDGERRADVLSAIRWHTLGNPEWARVGRALYMADYLEPGRKFSPGDRAFLAAQVPHDFDGVFRQVVRQRIEWSVRDGKPLYPETVGLWNRVH
jgi:2-amino-4-hydroxy-6-hydroxymethyldihydropteridine diphosphokinase